MNLDLLSRIVRIERRLDNLVKPERGWTPHFLTTPYTNADFNGDSFSDVAVNTVIENTSWSTTIPTNAKALLIEGECYDSGSAATANLYVALYGAALATNAPWVMSPSGQNNDGYAFGMGIVPCTDGDIWYRVVASGVSTMDIWLECFGWWE